MAYNMPASHLAKLQGRIVHFTWNTLDEKWIIWSGKNHLRKLKFGGFIQNMLHFKNMIQQATYSWLPNNVGCIPVIMYKNGCVLQLSGQDSRWRMALIGHKSTGARHEIMKYIKQKNMEDVVLIFAKNCRLIFT